MAHTWWHPFTDYITGTGSNSLIGDITDNAGNIALGTAGLGLLSNAYSRLGDIGDESQAGANVIAQQGLQQSQFQPFTVRSTTGSQFGFTPAQTPSYSAPYVPPTTTETPAGGGGGGGGGGNGGDPQPGTFPGQPTPGFDPYRSQRTPVPGSVRDTRFIDNNGNGIDDRNEQASLGSSAQLDLSMQEQFIQDMLQGQAENALFDSPYGQVQRQQAAQQAFGLGGQFMGAAQMQPADINLLRGMFTQQAAGALGQPSNPPVFIQGVPPISGNPLRRAPQNFDMPENIKQLPIPKPVADVFPQQPAQPGSTIGQFGQQALGMGAAGLGAQAPSDIEALRRQYAGLAGQAAQGVLTPQAGREADVFERIRATQRPEEERQRLALEERMAQQGRLGVRTAMFGGAPEQFALAQAQEEAQNRASLAAIQQAQAERQQALGTAQALGGMFGQQAGLSSQLQSAAQQRAAQLSQLGLSAQQIESQLQSEGLGRAATSAQQAGQLAQLAGGLQAQQAGLGAQFAGLGSQLSMQDMAAQQAQQQLALGALTGSYIPQAQLMNVAQLGMTPIEMAQRGQLYGAGLFGEGSMTGLQSRLAAALGQTNLFGAVGSGLLSGALGVTI